MMLLSCWVCIHTRATNQQPTLVSPTPLNKKTTPEQQPHQNQYGPENWREGKAAARDELRRRMGLCAGDVPIVAVVTRLVHQKGIHLIKHAAWRALERGAQFVLLGSAPDGRVQGEFNALRDQLARQYPERAALWFTYDEPLSHLIFAASDMFLVPSIFEPCGLTQMVAMRCAARFCVFLFCVLGGG
jgi:glycogen synthase